MEEEVPLLGSDGNTSRGLPRRWTEFSGKLNRVNSIALPMILATLSQYLLRVSPIFMLGHLGKLSLSGAAIATSLSNVTGFSLLFGMCGALETLCGQAFGAGEYRKLGTCTWTALLCLFLVCIPVSVLWLYTEKLLIFAGQDPLISAEAGKYTLYLIPTLFPYAILQSLVRYLQTQSLVLLMLCSSLASLFIQLLLCWTFVFKLNLGSSGAALSIGIAYWFNVVVLVSFVIYSPTCKKTHASFSREVFGSVTEFFKFAIPSAVMVCLEWWSFEVIILLSGLLPNPQLETSVLSICFTITSVHYHIPYSFGAAASTLVSNELGAGKPTAAKAAFHTVLLVSSLEFIVASVAIFICRGVLGFAFSGQQEVVDYVKQMSPFLCFSIVFDSIQAVLSGVTRGSGRQHIGAIVNLGSYYFVGIPVALLLGFVFHLKGEGLWSGVVSGAGIQSSSLAIITCLTNWEKQATMARERIFAGKISSQN